MSEDFKECKARDLSSGQEGDCKSDVTQGKYRPISSIPTIVQVVVFDETGDTKYRLKWPAEALARQRSNWRVLNIHYASPERFDWIRRADLVVLYHSMENALLPLLAERRAKGLKSLVEYNDNFYEPPPWSPVGDKWGSPSLTQVYEQFMRLADGVITTCPELARVLRQNIETPVHVLINYLPSSPPPLNYLLSQKSPAPSFGWAGSLGHAADILAVGPVLWRILDVIPGSSLHLMGNTAFADNLRIPATRLRFSPWGTMEQYYHFWEQVWVGFVPLLDTPYNCCRSDVKAVEMASRGVLPILPKMPPYEEFILKTGAPSFSSFAELQKLINHYLTHNEERLTLANRCYEYVASERIADNNTERAELYEALLTSSATQRQAELGRSSRVHVCRHERAVIEWPDGAGFIEINSHLPVDVPVPRPLEALDGLAPAEALQHPLAHHDPELALRALDRWRRQIGSTPISVVLEMQERFPRDIRFNLLRILSHAETSEVMLCWSEIIDRLEVGGEGDRNFSLAMICRNFVRSLMRHPQLIELAPRLLKVYPYQAELRFAVAKELERQGDYTASAEHFRELLKWKKIVSQSREVIDGLESSYLQAWFEALKARIGGLGNQT